MSSSLPTARCAVVALALVPSVAALNCWSGRFTRELCCDLSVTSEGNPQCWNEDYTFATCCEQSDKKGVPSAQVDALKIDPASVMALPLLGTEQKIPMSGMGLGARPSARGDAVRQGVLDFLMMGGRHLDDATLYNNHREVGTGVRQAIALGVPRSEIFFTTKILPADFGFESTTAWIDRMLEEVGLDYVDLVLLHSAGVPAELNCTSPTTCRQETWLALTRARANGKIRNLGVSNFGVRQIRELLAVGAPVTVNQLEYHPWVKKEQRDATEYCHKRGIVVTAYGSMGSRHAAQQVLSQDALGQLGARHGKTAGQVLLRWAIQKNVSVIPGTSTPSHLHENLRIFDFRLTDEEMGFLDSVPENQRRLYFGLVPDEKP